MQALNVSDWGIGHMLRKGRQILFKVTDAKTPAALILKQELLSKGGECALGHNAILGVKEPQSLLLMATEAQYERVITSLREQDFALKQLADQLEEQLAAITSKLRPIHYQTPYLKGSLTFERPLIMGIANITPDSFYDGGNYFELEQAVEHILALAEQGADIIDIGGASSRPGHAPISAEEELARVLPVIEAVAPKLKVPISIDTDKPTVAAQALAAGAAIINDISGLPPQMAEVAKTMDVPIIVMHQGGGSPIIEQISDFFNQAIGQAVNLGIKKRQIILDPGIGFGKDIAENLQILQQLADLTAFGLPLLVGLSNKRFVGAVTNQPLDQRSVGNTAASVWALSQGAQIVRTHQSAEMLQAVKMVAAIQNGGAGYDGKEE
jgi:dihydropteroate synthase